MFKYPLFKPYYSPEFDKVISSVLQTGAIASGPYIDLFEKGLGAILEKEYVLSMSDMSAAMFLALYLSDVRQGDEVATTAFACMSSNSPVHAIGAKPLWIDVAPGSLHMDPEQLEASITPKTKAVILYHTAGYPAEAKKIAAICKKHGLRLIEDCDNSLLSSNIEGLCGTWADFSVYSFYPNRLINGIEGGALVFNDKDDFHRAKKLRRFGIDGSKFRNSLGEINNQCDIPEIGWSIGMSNVNCAVAYTQLHNLNDRIATIKRNAKLIDNMLQGNEKITYFHHREDDDPVHWVYLLKIKNRDAMIMKLKEAGIHASSLHQRNDIYSGFHASLRNMPNTTELQDNVLALPVGWWLSEEDTVSMVETFLDIQTRINDEI